MRKSTVISPCVRAQKSMSSISTDEIRAYMDSIFVKAGGDSEQIPSVLPQELRPNRDTLAWICIRSLIKQLNDQQKDALIEGIAIPPTGVRNLELQYPNLKVRAAFVGYSKTIEFQIPEWTPELENLTKTAIGKEYLENFAKNYDWLYRGKDGKLSPYNDSPEARKIEDAVETIRKSGCENFKYFDLINYIPQERRSEEPAITELEDYIDAAMDIRSFLLG